MGINLRKNINTKQRQFEIMLNFMTEHPQLAKGYIKAPNAKQATSNLWTRLAEDLNAADPLIREVVGWKKVELLQANGESILESVSVCINSYDFMAYKLSISTRYYETEVQLFECNDLTSIPHAVKKKIEGCVFYFDSNNLNFLSDVKTIVKFVQDNNIEVSALITRNIFENNLPGVSYDEVQSMCKVYVNVIDLNVKSVNGKRDGFAEVIELLKNHIWSSVNISTCNANKMFKLTANDVNVEEALTEFEELMNMFQQFKNVSQTMRREEVLKNAENLAELFANMLNED